MSEQEERKAILITTNGEDIEFKAQNISKLEAEMMLIRTLQTLRRKQDAND